MRQSAIPNLTAINAMLHEQSDALRQQLAELSTQGEHVRQMATDARRQIMRLHGEIADQRTVHKWMKQRSLTG